MEPQVLTLHPINEGTDFQLDSARLIVAGYTGRNIDDVNAHIRELSAIGIPAPASVPTFYEIDVDLLTTDPVIEVKGLITSGEVEPVLIRHGSDYYLGVGSDHTDRDLERKDVAESKASCPKPLSPQVIMLPRNLGSLDWDSINIQSTVDGTIYQRGTLKALRTPLDLFSRLAETTEQNDTDLVLFAGTIPLLAGKFVAGTNWQISLIIDPEFNLTHSYEVQRRFL